MGPKGGGIFLNLFPIYSAPDMKNALASATCRFPLLILKPMDFQPRARQRQRRSFHCRFGFGEQRSEPVDAVVGWVAGAEFNIERARGFFICCYSRPVRGSSITRLRACLRRGEMCMLLYARGGGGAEQKHNRCSMQHPRTRSNTFCNLVAD